jgi:hypothetical protein
MKDKYKFKKLLSIFLIIFVLFGYFNLFSVQNIKKVEAQIFVPVSNIIQEAIDTGNLAVNTEQAVNYGVKEYALDVLVYILNEIIIEQITQSIVSWIQGSSDGNPGFLTNFESFHAELRNQAIGAFINGDGTGNRADGKWFDISALCSPYQLQVQLALIRNFYPSRPQCTWDTVVGNLEAFASGNFTDGGGWPAWLALTQSPGGNIFSAYSISENNILEEIARRTGEEEKLLDWGNGFLTIKKCDEYLWGDDGAGEDWNPCSKARYVTPGTYIEEAIPEVTIKGASRKLSFADEIDEILGALLTRLLTELFTGSNGLADYDRNTPTGITPPNIPGLPPIIPGSNGLPPLPSDPSLCLDGVPGSQTQQRAWLTGGPWTVDESGTLPKDRRFTMNLDGHYYKMLLEFDYFLSEFNSGPPHDFQAFWEIRNIGGNRILPDPGASSRWGPRIIQMTTATALGDHRGGSGAPRAGSRNQAKENTWYHISVDYDAVRGNMNMQITERDSGNLFVNLTNDAYYSLFPQDGGSSLILSGENLDENVPKLTGAMFENIEMTLEPGVVCAGITINVPEDNTALGQEFSVGGQGETAEKKLVTTFPVSLVKPGLFLDTSKEDSNPVGLPLKEDGVYRKASFDFDLIVNNTNGGSILSISPLNMPYLEYFDISLDENGLVLERQNGDTINWPIVLKKNVKYHFHLEYNSMKNILSLSVENKDSGEKKMFVDDIIKLRDIEVGSSNVFALFAKSENTLSWKFSDLSIQVK